MKKLTEAIERKRDSEKLLERGLVYGKDLAWLGKTLFSTSISSGSRRIQHVNFAVTYNCNSRCVNCNIWKKQEEAKELSLNEIKGIFSSKFLKNIKSIQLTGGEPFLRRDFVELCGFFIERYPHANIGIPTNAVNNSIIGKIGRILREYKPKNIDIGISLDGIGKKHDEIRGIPGNYAKAIALIKEMKKRFPKVNLGINFTITQENYKELLKVYGVSKKENIEFGFQFAQISECYYDNSEKHKSFVWDEKKLEEAENTIKSIIYDQKKTARSDNYGLYFSSKAAEFQRNGKRKISCFSGSNSLFLDPYGNVFPCIMMGKKMGNVRTKKFDEIWLSDKADNIRKIIREKKCSCWTPCETMQSLNKKPRALISNILGRR